MKVVFIIVDCMRWDYMNHNGYPRPTTPNIDAIAEQSCTFNRAYAAINQTDQSLTSMFSGLYPVTHGFECHAVSLSSKELSSSSAWKIRYLPQMLKESGFLTLGVDWLDRWHQWGYDWYWARDRRRRLWKLRRSVAPWVIRFQKAQLLLANPIVAQNSRLSRLAAPKPCVGAEAVTDWALRMLKQHRENDLFLMLHYWDAHVPYQPESLQYYDEMRSYALPGERQSLKDYLARTCHSSEYKRWVQSWISRRATTKGDLIAEYCSSIRSVDEQIGVLYRFLEENHLLDETVFVLTADHGENLFEHGDFIEHTGVRENIVHIPLVMRFPGIESMEVEEVVSHVDVVPTLASYLGMDMDMDLDGFDLVSLITRQEPLDREYVFFQSRAQEPDPRWGIVGSTYKCIESRDPDPSTCEYCGRHHAPSVELYDLMGDPSEQQNLAQNRPELCRELSLRLKQAIECMTGKHAALASKDAETVQSVYSEGEKAELEQRLRSLGYLD
jgi:arylsulfatase A-like enzyme